MGSTLTLDDDSEVELEHDKDDYADKHIFQKDNYLVVGYLSPDHYPHVEQEFWDRFSDEDSTARYAFGFDKYGDKDMDSIYQEDMLDFLREKIIEGFKERQESGWYMDAFHLTSPINSAMQPFSENSLETVLENLKFVEEMEDFIEATSNDSKFESLKDDLWLKKCKNGDFGDLYAVALKERYGLSIDQSFNYADPPERAWLPNDDDKENINIKVARSIGYEFDYISGGGVELTGLDGGKTVFVGYADAIKSIMASMQKHPEFIEMVRSAAADMAASFVSDYNDLNDGNVYCLCVEQFIRESDDEDSEWRMVEADSCGGYIGTEGAKSELAGRFEYIKRQCLETNLIEEKRIEEFGSIEPSI